MSSNRKGLELPVKPFNEMENAFMSRAIFFKDLKPMLARGIKSTNRPEFWKTLRSGKQLSLRVRCHYLMCHDGHMFLVLLQRRNGAVEVQQLVREQRIRISRCIPI